MSEAGVAAREVLVRSMCHESDGVISLRLESLDSDVRLAEWEPGAHVDVVVGDGSTRQYSLCGRPDELDYRIAVLREPNGRGGSDHVHTVIRPGQTLTIKGPRNNFVLEDAPGYRFVAGGIGITPILPMLAKLDSEGRDWRLHYAGRTRSTMAFRDELEKYGDKVVVTADDEGAMPDLARLVKEAPDGALIYACGPEGMLAALGRAAETAGRVSCLRTERFAAPVAAEPPTPGDGFSVELRSSGITLDIPADRSILDIVAEAGIDVMSDCKEGICGSCETTVLEGEPDHRDYVLTNQEKAANTCMMICVSRANCSKLVLDL